MMNKIWVSAFVVMGVFIAIALFVSFYLPSLEKVSKPGIKLSPGDTIGQGLELYYPFDNVANGITPDMSNSGRHGAVTDGYLANTIYGRAMQFNGQHFVNVTGSDIDVENVFTISTWIKLDNGASVEDFNVILSDQFPGNWPSVMFYVINSSGNVNLKVHKRNDNENFSFVVSNVSLTKGTWYNLIGKLEGNNLSIYVNGLLKGKKVLQDLVPYNNNKQFMVGSSYGNNLFLHGALNELRFYNRALTEEEITYLADSDNIPGFFGVGLPNVYLLSPLPGSAVRTANVEFRGNFTDDLLLNNATFYIWNSSESMIHSANVLLAGTSQVASVSYTLPYTGDYKWGFKVTDSEGNSTFSPNATLSYDLTLPLITIINPLNISHNDSITSLQFSASDAHLDSCWYSLNNGATNNSATCNQQVSVFATNGNYNWAVYANDSAGNVNFSKVAFSVTDDAPPVIDFDVPTNRTYLSSTLLFKITLNEKGDAWFNLDGGDSVDMNTSDNKTFTYRVSDLSRGSHVAAFTAEDLQDNSADVNVVFSVNANTGTSGTGTSGTTGSGPNNNNNNNSTIVNNDPNLDDTTNLNVDDQQYLDKTGGDAESSGVDSLFWIIVGLVLLSAAIVVTIVIILIVHKNRQQVQQTQQQGPQYRQGGVVVSGNTGNNFR